MACLHQPIRRNDLYSNKNIKLFWNNFTNKFYDKSDKNVNSKANRMLSADYYHDVFDRVGKRKKRPKMYETRICSFVKKVSCQHAGTMGDFA